MNDKYYALPVGIDIAQLSPEQKDHILQEVAKFFSEFSYESFLEAQVLIAYHQSEDQAPNMPYMYGHVCIVGDFYKAVRHHTVTRKNARV